MSWRWKSKLCNSYSMGCPPVHGDNPRALASGLSYVQVDEHGIAIYTAYISVDLAHHEIFHAKVGKGGIILHHSLFYNSLPPGKFVMIFGRLLIFYKINLFKKFFQEYRQTVKQFGSRSGLMFCPT